VLTLAEADAVVVSAAFVLELELPELDPQAANSSPVRMAAVHSDGFAVR
jgi:hypothetical protein